MKRVMDKLMVTILVFGMLITNYFTGLIHTSIMEVNAAEEHKSLKFTFDDEKNGFTSNGFAAEKNGNGVQITNLPNGNVLKLDGSSYLRVKDQSGNSPLNGLDEFTISYKGYSTEGRSDNYWGWSMYAAPDASTQALWDESYLGVRDLPNGLLVERFYNGRNESNQHFDWSADDNDWKYVTIVFRKGQTDTYVNGQLVSSEKSDYSIKDILGNNSIFYIGCANWMSIGQKEYYTGYLDDYEIINYALTEQEILERCVGAKFTGSASTESKDYKLGSNVEFDIPSDIPVIGGGKCALDFGNIPIQYEREGNAVRFGIGVSDLVSLKKEGWFTFKKFVETQKENYKKGINHLLASKFGTASIGMNIKPEISCYGYAEGTVTEAGFQLSGGKAVIEIKSQASQEWQTTVVVVPVVIKATGEVGVKSTVSVGLDFSRSNIYFKGQLDLTLPKIKLSAGVGIAYIADVSVYGSAENKVLISESNGASAYLIGEMGVSAKALCFSYEKPLLKGEWNYYNSSNKKMRSLRRFNDNLKDDWAQDMEIDDTKPTKFAGSLKALSASEEEKVIQSSVYDAANPKLIKTADGTLVMTYINAISGRGNGNQYAAVYSIYDKNTKTWSQPKVIDDDQTADYDVKVSERDNKVYFVWTNMKETVNEDELSADNEKNLKNMAAMSEVEMACLDLSDKTVDTYKITDNSVMDYSPTAGVDEKGEVYVSWSENKNNDILSLSGENNVYFGKVVNGSFVKLSEKKYKNPVSNVVVGLFGNEMVTSYVVKKDENDYEVKKLKANGSEEAIFTNEQNIINLTIGKINGKDALTWYTTGAKGGFNAWISGRNKSEVLIPDDGIINGGYYICSEADDTKIFCAAGSDEDENKTGIYKYDIEDGAASTGTQIYQAEGELNNISVCKNNSGYMMIYTNGQMNMQGDDMDINTNLCAAALDDTDDLKITKFDYNEEELKAGQSTTLMLDIKNKGLKPSDENAKYEILINDEVIKSGTIGDLASGDEKEIEVSADIPEDYFGTNQLSVRLIENGVTKASKNEQVGKPDLEVSATKNEKNAVVKVENTADVDANATLYVYDTDASGKLLQTVDLGTIAGNNSVEKEIDISSFDEIESLMFTIQSDKEELFDFNNNTSLYIGNNELKTLDYIVAEKDVIGYTAGDNISLSDLKVRAVYTDSTSKEIKDYTTNVNTIDVDTEGEKTLTVSYEEVGLKSSVDIPITITPLTEIKVKTDSGLTVTKGADSNKQLVGLKTGTNTVQDICTRFSNKSLTFVNQKGSNLTTEDNIGTGTIISIMDGDKVVDSVTAVVLGDINGDGETGTQDITLMARSRVGTATLSDVQEKAGDVIKDSGMNTKDISKLLRVIAGKDRL